MANIPLKRRRRLIPAEDGSPIECGEPSAATTDDEMRKSSANKRVRFRQALALAAGLRFRCRFLLICVIMLAVTISISNDSLLRETLLSPFSFEGRLHSLRHRIRPLTLRDLMATTVVLPHHSYKRENFQIPRGRYHRLRTPDYANLDMFSLMDKQFFQRGRRIHPRDLEIHAHYRKQMLGSMHSGNSSYYHHDEELDQPRECQRNNWRSSVHTNCNIFHETATQNRDGSVLQYHDSRVLGKGYYRITWLMKSRTRTNDEPDFVLKQMKLASSETDSDHLPAPESFLKIQNEAIIMERLTSSPRIVTSYGHCGLSIMAENMPGEVSKEIMSGKGYIQQSELDKEKYWSAKNNLTTTEKLDMAIVMAETIADIHGYEGGIIVHGDVHPVQYLRGPDHGDLRLNDFNNAEILDWDVRNNKYCRTDRGSWGGMYRSPEEYTGTPIDEQIDTFSMGNNIYVLLTGLWPFYEDEPYSVVMRKVLRQERPFVDPRLRRHSWIENEMVQIMEKMWAPKPQDRPTIFQVVEFLRNVKQRSITATTSNPGNAKKEE